MKINRNLSGSRVLVIWTLLTIVGQLVALLGSIILYFILGIIVIEQGPLEMIVSPLYVGASQIATFFIFGSILGYWQWIALDRREMSLKVWLVANGLGWTVALMISMYLIGQQVLEVSIIGLMSGMIIGFAQWNILRVWNSRAVWWIGICALSYGLAIHLVFENQYDIFNQFRINSSQNPIQIMMAIGCLVGVMTGLGLVWPIKWHVVEKPGTI